MAQSQYAQYCEQRGVTALGLYIPQQVNDMLKAIAARDKVKVAEFVRDTIIEAVNGAGLTYPDGSDWTYTPVTPLTAREQLEKQQAEIAELKAQLAALSSNLPAPTPPSLRANEKGELEEVAA